MEPRIRKLEDLSSAEREVINNQIARLRSDYGLSGELLSLGQLARVLGQSEAALRNRRARSQMPPIPARRMGGQEFYWVGHVAMWLFIDFVAAPIAIEPISTRVRGLAQQEEASKQVATNTDAGRNGDKTKRGEESAAKMALMARANSIFEERMREQRKK